MVKVQRNLLLVPNRVWFFLTGTCNNSCVWCYRKGSEVNVFLDTEKVLRFAEVLSEAGVQYCTLAGGEPLLHPAFPFLLENLSRKFKSCAVVTNGRRFSVKSVVECLPAENVRITISLHGADNQQYFENTGSRNGFQEVLVGVRNLQERGISPSFSVVLGPENIPRIAGFIEIATRFGAESICFTLAIPSIDDPSYKVEVSKIPEAVEVAHRYCIEVNQKHLFVLSLPWCLFPRTLLESLAETGSIMFRCPVPGGNIVVVKENGAIGLCSHTAGHELLDSGKAQTILSSPDSFLRFWNSDEMQRLRLVIDVHRNSECISCSYRSLCRGGCPLWWKFYEFGSALKRYSYGG